MPIPQTIRVNPLDLQGNIAIGVSLPFNGPAGPFNSTYSTKDQVKSNLINLLLTNKGERIMNPEFGCDLKRVLFEGITDDLAEIIQEVITNSIDIFIPEIELVDIIVDLSSRDTNTILINIKYKLRISQEADQVTIEFT
jgi:phage baseplate assembly protein W